MVDSGIRLEVCVICSVELEDHLQREADGRLNHKFSRDGSLETVNRSTPKKQPRPMPVVVGAYDLELRQILINKGIIDHEDFAALRNSGSGSAGDRETGEPEGSG